MLNEDLSSESPFESDESIHGDFVRKLTIEEIVLLRLLESLYNGDWSALENDIQDRLRGQPVIYKISHRLQRDIESLKKLRSYEQKNNISLINLLPTSPESKQFLDFNPDKSDF